MRQGKGCEDGTTGAGDAAQATHNQYKAEAEERQAGLATAAREARAELEAAQQVRQEAEQRAQKLQEQLDTEKTAHKVQTAGYGNTCFIFPSCDMFVTAH